jgi:hypothetical protein
MMKSFGVHPSATAWYQVNNQRTLGGTHPADKHTQFYMSTSTHFILFKFMPTAKGLVDQNGATPGIALFSQGISGLPVGAEAFDAFCDKHLDNR